MKKNILIKMLSACLLCISCTQQRTDSNKVIDLSFRKVEDTIPNHILDMSIKHVEYIPLELTEQSEIADIIDICLTNQYIFIISTKSSSGVLQFDRKGNFVRAIAPRGTAPGEVQIPQTIYTDSKEEKLYISEFFSVSIFNMKGEFIEKKEIKRPYSYQYLINDNISAEVGREYVPFATPNMFTLGVFEYETGDTIALHLPYNHPNIPMDIMGIKQVYCSRSTDGLLVNYCGTDTIFNLTESGIIPAYHLDLQNSEIARVDALKIRNEEGIGDNDFQLWDFGEINEYFFYRAIQNGEIHIYLYDKKQEKTYMNRSDYNPNDLIGLNWRMTTAGIPISKSELPFAPYKVWPIKKIALQYYTVPEIQYLKEQVQFKEEMLNSIKEESNPILIFYHLK